MIHVADYLTAAQRADVTEFRGALDVTEPLARAFGERHQLVRLVAGVYRVDGALPPPVCAAIEGEGQENTVLSPGLSARVFLAVNGGGPVELSSFKIDGSRTRGAIGLRLGDASAAQRWHGRAMNLRIENFRGDGAYGLHVADAIKALLQYVRVVGNETNALFRNIAPIGFPTTLACSRCEFVNGVTDGAAIQSGESLVFDGCLFEGNGQRGAAVDSAGGRTIANVLFVNGCWFEDNWRGDPNFADRFQFSCFGPSGTARVVLRDAYFHGGGRAARAIKLSGPAVAGFRLDNVQVPNRAGQIVIERGAWGLIDSWAPNLSRELVVQELRP